MLDYGQCRAGGIISVSESLREKVVVLDLLHCACFGTLGDKQLWKLSYPIVSADLPRKIPPSLHKSASFKTMQTVAGPCKTKNR